ncbi:MAG: hypothetical protein JWQ07_5592 [Ramlibacter sp.]|nr:hypothetical protein [Ramlibacter sp.]
MRYIIILFATGATCATLFFCAGTLAPAPISAEYWVREMIAVKRSIAQSNSGRKKIVIAGGSSTLFGIDSRLLGEELGIVAVNYGLHAGLGLAKILGETAGAVGRGDLLLLALETPLYCVDEPTGWQARNAIAWDPDTWNSWSLRAQIRGLSLDPRIAGELVAARTWMQSRPDILAPRVAALDDALTRAKFAEAPPPTYFSYSAFHMDDLGNMQRAEGARYQGPASQPESRTRVCGSSMQMLSAFALQMREKGVRLYFVNPPYLAPRDVDKGKVDESDRQFAREIAPVGPVLDHRSDVIFDRNYFFNTRWHLNVEGRRLRTQRLVQALRSMAATALPISN